MWRWIIFAIFALAFIVFLTNTNTQKSIEGASSAISEWFDNTADLPDKRRLAELRDEFLHNNLSLQPHQTDYVFKITESIDELRKYNQLYCINDDKNPFIFGANKVRLCKKIIESGLLKKR